MGGLRTFATVAGGAGMFIIFADRIGWLPPGLPYRAQVIGAAVLALAIGGSLLVVADAWKWYRERLPTRQRREEVAALAVRLGLRSLERATISLDRSLPLLRPTTQWREPLRTVLGRSLTILGLVAFTFWLVLGFIAGIERQSTATHIVEIGGSLLAIASVVFIIRGIRHSRLRDDPREWFAANATRPRAAGFDWIFGGKWTGLDVHIFDYWGLLGNSKQEWTCVLMPTDVSGPELEVNRRPVGGGGTTVNVLTETDEGILDTRTRSLLRGDDTWELIQLGGRQLLYCGQRVPLEAREGLLKAANRFRDCLPAT
jgi:hypothetical protein